MRAQIELLSRSLYVVADHVVKVKGKDGKSESATEQAHYGPLVEVVSTDETTGDPVRRLVWPATFYPAHSTASSLHLTFKPQLHQTMRMQNGFSQTFNIHEWHRNDYRNVVATVQYWQKFMHLI